MHARIFAAPLGLGEDWLRATWHGAADDPAFTSRQALLVRAVDELHVTGAWRAQTAVALEDAYPPAQLVELVCLVGFYHLVSFCSGAFALEPEPWARNPPGFVPLGLASSPLRPTSQA